MKNLAHRNPGPAAKRVLSVITLLLITTVSPTLLAQETGTGDFPPQGSLPPNPIAGRMVFEEKGCLDCHAIDGYGGTVGPDLGVDKFFGNFYDLGSRLWNHAPQMIVQSGALEKKWAMLTSAELDQLISYLFYLRYLGEPGNVSQGKKLIESKGCLSCHRIGQDGAPGGIALDQLQEYASPLYIAQVIWNHGPAMEAQMMTMAVERPTFNDADITHISAYLRAFTRTRSTRRQYMSPGNPQVGAQLFQSQGCAYCHAIADDVPSRGARLSEMNLHRSVTAIAGTMWNHGNIMRDAMQEERIEWPTFEGSQMADLIAYLYFFDYQGSPGDPQLGRKVFETKSCISCHGPQQSWALDQGIDLARPTDLVRTMWNHVPHMRELIVTMNIDWPELTAEELRDLYAYLLRRASEN